MTWTNDELSSELYLPKILMPDWAEVSDRKGMFQRLDRLGVISTVDRNETGRWLHVSASFPDHLPSFFDMSEVKLLFMGPHVSAIHIFPKLSEHINHHPYCIHLWSALDGQLQLPDFRRTINGTLTL